MSRWKLGPPGLWLVLGLRMPIGQIRAAPHRMPHGLQGKKIVYLPGEGLLVDVDNLEGLFTLDLAILAGL